ncbi:unnamed protein product [Protopolystoma xenopodis]|uniref:Uncharacterized protein n=1 Tax=Protopolystoma xenopodis TaxID=117903 RepID=A0A448WUP6_9PLAT|nr:unnamed protein product [Protopolystoma xenopodis]
MFRFPVRQLCLFRSYPQSTDIKAILRSPVSLDIYTNLYLNCYTSQSSPLVVAIPMPPTTSSCLNPILWVVGIIHSVDLNNLQLLLRLVCHLLIASLLAAHPSKLWGKS